LGVIEDFKNVDLDERSAVAAVENPLQVGTFIAVQIVVDGADIDARRSVCRLGE
jgi:hypothetical protein